MIKPETLLQAESLKAQILAAQSIGFRRLQNEMLERCMGLEGTWNISSEVLGDLMDSEALMVTQAIIDGDRATLTQWDIRSDADALRWLVEQAGELVDLLLAVD